MAAWVIVGFIPLIAISSIVVIEAHGKATEQKLEAELNKLQSLKREYWYDPSGVENRRIEFAMEMGDLARAKDRKHRQQAIANIIFVTVFEGSAFALVAIYAPRPRSMFRAAVLGGALGAGVLGLCGATVSQFAPVLGSYLERQATDPFAPHQLGMLLGHTLLFGVVGLLLGVGLVAASRTTPRAT